MILVDDMLHDGKRLQPIVAPASAKTGTPIRQVLVGYLTGMGRDLMAADGLPVWTAIYYLPNLRMRFVESTLYPFIGGDTVRRDQPIAGRPACRAINRIFPYAAPDYAEDCADRLHLPSCPCAAWRTPGTSSWPWRAEYRSLYARNLTLSRLGEAVILPLCPDKGGCMTYDLSRAASHLSGRTIWRCSSGMRPTK